MIAGSKLILSAALGFSTLTLILPVIKDRSMVILGIILYMVGFIVGMVGVGSLANNHWEGTALRFVTYVFIGLWASIALIGGFGIFIVCCNDDEDNTSEKSHGSNRNSPREIGDGNDYVSLLFCEFSIFPII
jgi:hypothetical protein